LLLYLPRSRYAVSMGPHEVMVGDRNYDLTTTPPSNIQPTIVVPVLVAFGSGTPLACKAALRLWFEKSKPGMLRGRALELSNVYKLTPGSCTLMLKVRISLKGELQ
jgi:hypothetical protein